MAGWRAVPGLSGAMRLSGAVGEVAYGKAGAGDGVPPCGGFSMFELRRDGLRARAIRPARGQSFVEYALIIVFVALAIVAALALLGPQIAGIFDTINSAF